jgi:DNA-binding NtrC family response regulator
VKPVTKAIVLVDDEKSYTELISQLLTENLDCTVVAFTRPKEALQALPDIAPGVVVTDYFMPELNGIDFIRQASPLVPNTAFVMITGHNLTAQADQLAQLPALKAFLAKPFGWRTLADEILRVWPSDLPSLSHRADATSL